MKLDYSKVEEYCEELKQINIDMKKQLDSIKSTIGTINNNWTGNASDYYLKQINKVSINFDEFYSELNACVLFIQKCSDNYEKLDLQAKNAIDEVISSSKIFN